MSDKYGADNCVVVGCFLLIMGNYFGKILLLTDSNKIIRMRLYLDNIINNDREKQRERERERKQ